MNCPNCEKANELKDILKRGRCPYCKYPWLLDDIEGSVVEVSKILFPEDYQRPELIDADKAAAERDSKALIKKYGYNNLPKILAALAVENVRLVKEINEHRAARGIDPLPTFEV